MSYDPIADLKTRGVPCDHFDQPIKDVLKTLDQSEVIAFTAIWGKAAHGGLNPPPHGPPPPPGHMTGWIFGKIGY